MSDEQHVVYISRARIERIKGPLRRVELPAEEDPIFFGVHDEIAEHYGTDLTVHEPHAATLDYLIAAAAGWLTGTFGGALEARGIPAGEGKLSSDVEGDIEKEGKLLVIKRIRVTYYLKADPEHRETIERVHRKHADFCPVALSIRDCIEISTQLEFLENNKNVTL